MPGSRSRLLVVVLGKTVPSASDEKTIVLRLLVDLDSDRFVEREKATTELAQLGSLAEPTLGRLLQKSPSAEVRRRATALLEGLEHSVPPQRVAALRGTEVLERLGTPEARQLLREWAGGAEGAWLTCEAQAAVRRLGGRVP